MHRARTLLAVLALAGACALVDADAPVAAAAPPVSPVAPRVFSYHASDGQFTYSIDLRADRRWTRHEHSGHAPPRGRLSRRAMSRFRRVLAAAPFERRSQPCDARPVGHGSYRDHVRERGARSETAWTERGWIPCGVQTDPRTEAVLTCLEQLTLGRLDAGACRVDP